MTWAHTPIETFREAAVKLSERIDQDVKESDLEVFIAGTRTGGTTATEIFPGLRATYFSFAPPSYLGFAPDEVHHDVTFKLDTSDRHLTAQRNYLITSVDQAHGRTRESVALEALGALLYSWDNPTEPYSQDRKMGVNREMNSNWQE